MIVILSINKYMDIAIVRGKLKIFVVGFWSHQSLQGRADLFISDLASPDTFRNRHWKVSLIYLLSYLRVLAVMYTFILHVLRKNYIIMEIQICMKLNIAFHVTTLFYISSFYVMTVYLKLLVSWGLSVELDRCILGLIYG